MNMDMPEGKKYDIALSFAGEDRVYVEKVANDLQTHGVKVFYDLYEEALLWGKDLYVHLRKVYQQDATFTVMFISSAYATKLWTNHERQSAQARAFIENHEYILPARFDDTEVPGLPSTVGYIDLRKKSPSELSELIIEKLRSTGVFDESILPSHRLIDEYCKADDAVCLQFSSKIFTDKEHVGRQIAIDPSRFRNIGNLLDVLYCHYLYKYFKPYTYGEEWLITIRHGFYILLPWQSILSPEKSVSKLAPEWSRTTLRKLGIVKGTLWDIITTDNIHKLEYYFFGTNQKRLWRIITSSPKAYYYLLMHEYIKSTELNASTATSRRYNGVLRYAFDSPTNKRAWLHNDTPIPRKILDI